MKPIDSDKKSCDSCGGWGKKRYEPGLYEPKNPVVKSGERLSDCYECHGTGKTGTKPKATSELVPFLDYVLSSLTSEEIETFRAFEELEGEAAEAE